MKFSAFTVVRSFAFPENLSAMRAVAGIGHGGFRRVAAGFRLAVNLKPFPIQVRERPSGSKYSLGAVPKSRVIAGHAKCPIFHGRAGELRPHLGRGAKMLTTALFRLAAPPESCNAMRRHAVVWPSPISQVTFRVQVVVTLLMATIDTEGAHP